MALGLQGIQQGVGVQPVIAYEGDFASSNPRASVLMGPGGFISGSSGLSAGRFAWATSQFQDADNAPAVLNNFGSGPVTGFVGRHQIGLITQYLASATLLSPQGFSVWAYSAGDFFVRNASASYAGPGLKVFARYTDGAAYAFAAAGTAPPGSLSLTTSTIAAATAFAGTGSISGNVLTITNSTAGQLVPGSIITGTGVATGSQVVAQLTSTAAAGALGTTGTYALSIGEQSVSSTAIAGTYGILTVGGGGSPAFGSILSGGTAAAGTQVWGQLTATTFVVSPSQAVASATLTATVGIETKWITMSGGAATEVLKMSSYPLG